MKLATHQRYPHSNIPQRRDFSWPQEKRLAVYAAINLEYFAFGEPGGAALVQENPQPDVLNYAWRDYGNRVGIWRILDMFNELDIPATALANSTMLEHAPGVVEAFHDCGFEIVCQGRTNSEQQGVLREPEERNLIEEATRAITDLQGTAPTGWLGPLISQSYVTPDLLDEAGYEYLLDWAHDEQPVWLQTRGAPSGDSHASGKGEGRILSVPYPQELNDVPAIMGRRIEAAQFSQMIQHAYAVHLDECSKRSAVMGIALHPYLMGQAHRFYYLKEAFRTLKAQADERVWFTSPGEINRFWREHFPEGNES